MPGSAAATVGESDFEKPRRVPFLQKGAGQARRERPRSAIVQRRRQHDPLPATTSPRYWSRPPSALPRVDESIPWRVGSLPPPRRLGFRGEYSNSPPDSPAGDPRTALTTTPARLSAPPAPEVAAPEAATPVRRRGAVDFQRRNAVNNVALKTLLQAKSCLAPAKLKCSLLETDTEPRFTSLLAYLRCTTQCVGDTHVDLSDCPLTADDFVLLRSVLAHHPKVRIVNLTRAGVPQPTPAPLTAPAAANLIAAVEENHHIVSVIRMPQLLPPEWDAKLEERLLRNRRHAEVVAARAERRRQARVAAATRKGQHDALVRILCEEASESRRFAREEAISRLLIRGAGQKGHRRAQRAEERRVRGEVLKTLVNRQIEDDQMLRRALVDAESAEFLALTEIEEEALRCLESLLETRARQTLKRSERVGWSLSKRREKGRKQEEQAARAEMDAFAAVQLRESQAVYLKLLMDMHADERVARAEAKQKEELRMYEEDTVRRRIEAAKQKREQDEAWRIKQELYERERWEARRAKEREIVEYKEDKGRHEVARQWAHFCGVAGGTEGMFAVMARCNLAVTAARVAVTSFERQRDEVVGSPVVSKLVLSGSKANPRRFYYGLSTPVCFVTSASMSCEVQPDFVESMQEAERAYKAAIQANKEAVEKANDDLSEVWARWDTEKEKGTRQWLRHLLMTMCDVTLPLYPLGPRLLFIASTAAAAALTAAACGLPVDFELPSQSEPPSQGTTPLPSPKRGSKIQRAAFAGARAVGVNRLRKRQSVRPGDRREKLVQFFPDPVKRVYPPIDAVRRDKETIWGGSIRCRMTADAQVGRHQMFADPTSGWHTTAPSGAQVQQYASSEYESHSMKRERSASRLIELQQEQRRASVAVRSVMRLGHGGGSRRSLSGSPAHNKRQSRVNFSPESVPQEVTYAVPPDGSPQTPAHGRRQSVTFGDHRASVGSEAAASRPFGSFGDFKRKYSPRSRPRSFQQQRRSVAEMMKKVGVTDVLVTAPTDGTATVREAVEVLRTLSYRLQVDDATDISADVPFECRMEVTVTLLTREDLEAGTGAPPKAADLTATTVTSWVAVVVVPPYLFLHPDHRAIVYEEDSSADACAFLQKITVTDPTIVAAIDAQGRTISSSKEECDSYKIIRGGDSFDRGVLRLQLSQGYTPDDIVLFHWSEGCYLKQRPRRELINARRQWAIVQGAFDSEIQSAEGADQDAWLVFIDPGTGDDPVPFGELVQGQIFSTSKPPVKPVPGNSEIVIRLYTRLATADNVHRLLKRLRFGNFSQDPEPGSRRVDVSLTDAFGDPCTIQLSIDVLSSDDPATMELAAEKVFFRAPAAKSLPAELQKYLPKSLIRPAWGVHVQDVDTDRFAGGYVEMNVSYGHQKGDMLMFCAPILAAGDDPDSLSEPLGVHVRKLEAEFVDDDAGEHVYFEGRRVATLVKGVLHDPRSSKASMEALAAENDEETLSGVSLLFSADGSASIASCNRVLECVAWTSVLYRPKEGERGIDVCLQAGRSLPKGQTELPPDFDVSEELDPPLEDKMRVIVTPELFEVSQCSNSYREGSGEVRIAPFELLQDTMGYECEHYQGGFVMVEMVGGGTPDDILSMREGDHFRFQQVKPKEAAPPATQSPAPAAIVPDTPGEQHTPESSAMGADRRVVKFTSPTRAAMRLRAASRVLGSVGSNAVEEAAMALKAGRRGSVADKSESRRGSVASRLRDKIAPAARANLPLRDGLLAAAQQAVQARMALRKRGLDEKVERGQVTSYDVYDSSRAGGPSLGTLQMSGGLLVFAFGPRSGVKRADVRNVLRNLTYANISRTNEPEALNKVIRVTVNDGGQSSSYAAVAMEILEVDDVTEVVLKQSRVLFRHSFGRNNTPLAPLGFSWFEDPDTHFFDGGTLSVELISGHTKGDSLGFLTMEEQENAWKMAVAQSGLAPGGQRGLDDFPQQLIEARPDGTLVLPGTDRLIGTITKTTVREWAPSNNLRISFAPQPPTGPWVSIDLASLCLNCLTYSNTADRLTTGPRVYSISIQDQLNPSPGRGKVTIDVQAPLVALTGAPGTPKLSDAVTYKGDWQVLFPHAQINYLLTSPFVQPAAGRAIRGIDAKQIKDTLTHGSFSAAVTSGFRDGDVLQFDKKSPVDGRDGQCYFGRELVGRMQQSPQRISVEFGWTTKIKAVQLRDIIRSLMMKLGKGEGTRVVTVQIQDAAGARWAGTAEVRLSPPTAQ